MTKTLTGETGRVGDVEPRQERTPGKDGYRETHPAYGQIACARVSGGTFLYGSDFRHHNYMTLRISASELHHTLSSDWPHMGREYIEVALSEAQWARLLSSPNVGEGVQCTVTWLAGNGAVPGIAFPPDRKGESRREVDETILDALKACEDLLAEARSPSPKKSKIRELAEKAVREIKANLPFVTRRFDEHVEKSTEAAKTEVHAYINRVITRAGLDALGGSSDVLSLPEKDEGGGRDEA